MRGTLTRTRCDGRGIEGSMRKEKDIEEERSSIILAIYKGSQRGTYYSILKNLGR